MGNSPHIFEFPSQVVLATRACLCCDGVQVERGESPAHGPRHRLAQREPAANGERGWGKRENGERQDE